MSAKKQHLAVRLFGFSSDETAQLAKALARSPHPGHHYFCLAEDSLQDPDLVLGNGDDLKALAKVLAGNPSALQPAVVIGARALDIDCPRLTRPLDVDQMYQLFEGLIDQRNAQLAQMKVAGVPCVTERRRRPRLDLDVTDPAEYVQRRRTPPGGAVLIIDKHAALRDHVAKLFGARKLSIEWTDSPSTAVRLCEETPVSVVIINTSTPGIDPYGLSAAIKARPGAQRIAVVLLVNPAFAYNSARARAAGVRGLLDKPVADRHLLSALKKLLSLPA
jgi:CheY-like chemotaxis protein